MADTSPQCFPPHSRRVERSSSTHAAGPDQTATRDRNATRAGVTAHKRHGRTAARIAGVSVLPRAVGGRSGRSGGLAGPSRRQPALLGPCPPCTTRTVLRAAGDFLGIARRGPLRQPGVPFRWSAVLSDLVLASQKSGRRPLISAFARVAGPRCMPAAIRVADPATAESTPPLYGSASCASPSILGAMSAVRRCRRRGRCRHRC
jgi:hypothetical protein